jgi:glucan phosphoethanolaminetransferase (alkaline phosphatase superfamily)
MMTDSIVWWFLGILIVFIFLPVVVGYAVHRFLVRKKVSKQMQNIFISIVGILTWGLMQFANFKLLQQSIILSTLFIGFLFYIGVKYSEIKWKQNQRFDPIVKTPADEVEAQGTQGHP